MCVTSHFILATVANNRTSKPLKLASYPNRDNPNRDESGVKICTEVNNSTYSPLLYWVYTVAGTSHTLIFTDVKDTLMEATTDGREVNIKPL